MKILEYELKLLVTSAASARGALVATLLSRRHEVTRTDLEVHATAADGVVACDLGHDDSTGRLVAGMDAVVHIGHGGHFADPSTLIDFHTRRTYNLLTAAVAAGVGRFVNLSTLQLLEDYGEHLTVTENWRPLPDTDSVILAAHLCEYVCREFGREGGIKVANLRLGFPLVEGTTADAAASGETAALGTEDLLAAIEAALTVDLAAGAQSEASPMPASWRVVHVQSQFPGARFLMKTASAVFGFPAPEGAAL